MDAPTETTLDQIAVLGSDDLRSRFNDIAANCTLPPLPAVAGRIISLVREPGTHFEELSRLVAVDAALAARVLKIACCPIYVRRYPPETLNDAVRTLGTHD